MPRKIIIYGNPDKTVLGFPTPGDLKRYLEHDLIHDEGGRYRYTQGKHADIIILSRGGIAHGRPDVAARVKPNNEDRRRYPRVRFVYLVRSSTSYENPVALSILGIKRIRWGYFASEEEFELIEALAGTKCRRDFLFLPEEVPAMTYVEGAVTKIHVNAYERDASARQACIAHHKTRCKVCNLDFGERYGDIGTGFIHVHHRRELSTIRKRYRLDPLIDLVPVCPNCHAMLHRRSPPMDVEELKSLIARQARKQHR